MFIILYFFIYNCFGKCELNFTSASRYGLNGLIVISSNTRECSGDIKIPNSGIDPISNEEKRVEVIGWNAFSNSLIKSIEIPTSIKIICLNAFSNCNNLQNINIPKSVYRIDYQAFSNCKSLVSINFNNAEIKELGNELFIGCNKLKSIDLSTFSIETIYEDTFNGCYNLINVILPYTLREIKESAFSGCTSLTTINLHNTLINSIKEKAFKKCTSLITITFPSTLTSLSNNSFEKCTSLTSIIFQSVLSSSNNNIPFNECNKLKSIYYTGTDLFTNCIFSNNPIQNIYVNSEYQQDFICSIKVIKNINHSPIIYLCKYSDSNECVSYLSYRKSSINQLTNNEICYQRGSTNQKIIINDNKYYLVDCNNNTKIQYYQNKEINNNIISNFIFSVGYKEINDNNIHILREYFISKRIDNIQWITNQCTVTKHLYLNENENSSIKTKDIIIEIYRNGYILNNGIFYIEKNIKMNEIQTLYFGNEQMYREVLINDYFESMNQENEYIFECISKDLCKTYKFNTTNNLFIEDIDFPLLKKEIKTNILAIGYEYFHFYYSPYFSQQVKFTNYCENGKIFRTIGMELQLMSNFVNENECPKDDYSSFSIEIESKNETIEINSRIYKISVLDNRISDSTPIYLKFTNSYLRVIPNKCFQITNSSSLLFIPGIYGDKNYIFLKEYNSTNNCNGIYGISEFSPDQYSYTKFNINDDYSIISYFDNDYKDCGINKIEEASLIRYVLPDINKCQFKSTYTINEFNLIETKYDNSDCKGNIIIQESYALKRCINDTNQLHIIIATFPIKSEDCNNKFKGCINCDLDECYECPSGYGLSMKKDKCIDCSIFTNDCIQCNNQTCTKCNSIDNEIRVYHNNNCLTCKEAFNDNGCLECNVNNCTLCSSINGTLRYYNNGSCKTCEEAYDENCSDCDGIECKKCKIEYGLKIGRHGCMKCFDLDSKCLECGEGICTKCYNNLLFKNNKCQSCDDIYGKDCLSCDINNCLTCDNNKVVIESKCISCNKLFDHCVHCNTTHCLDCDSIAYSLSNGKCINQNNEQGNNSCLISILLVFSIILFFLI
ncbi:leucine rich repeatcontaining protein BspA family protein [Entamoeba histolytica KU27]|uniref:Leucine rich repeatcontaining protein BspA family protein n=1 Tax=Entamoeba histolytica KU27 TaxID=885311 RepID=M2R805_ENTHI|nr:leucine rich repeatcontaining protein BspA family protein [Entamoeba histolytica KU27]